MTDPAPSKLAAMVTASLADARRMMMQPTLAVRPIWLTTNAGWWPTCMPPPPPWTPIVRPPIIPNGRSPLTGANLYFRASQLPIPPGWEP